MLAQLRRLLLFASSFLFLSTLALAQVTTIEGDVKGADGQPVKGAVIKLVRTDIKGNYNVKSDKHGHWFYTGLPLGAYDITCEIDGKVVDSMKGVHSKYSESTTIDFDARKAAAQNAALQKSAESGQLDKDVARGLTAEQKAQLEKQAKERGEQLKKNKDLNDAFNAGMAAVDAKNYPEAIKDFEHANELDPSQLAIWDNLGATYLALAATQTGADKSASIDKAIDTYKKAIELSPNSAALYNQLGNAYGAAHKIPEAQDALNKAGTLDPSMAAKAFYNMGANLVNGGQNDAAADFFKKAVAADANYADAHYQLGICLLAKATVDSKTGKITPPEGTSDEFQKYLQLKPDGPFAQSAKEMLASLGETVQTQYSTPKKKK